MPDSSVGYGIVVSLLKFTTIKQNIHFVGLPQSEGLNSPLDKHRDVCPAMRTIGLFHLAMLLVREMSLFQGRK